MNAIEGRCMPVAASGLDLGLCGGVGLASAWRTAEDELHVM